MTVVKCKQHKTKADSSALLTLFEIGTYFSIEFNNLKPMNIVIKLSEANGNRAVKISVNIGNNTGDPATVACEKQELGYTARSWAKGDKPKR